MTSIHECIPAPYVPRPTQTEYLTWAEKEINNNDALVCGMPTATGKSLLCVTTGKFLVSGGNSVALITPRKLLQDQYLESFGWLPTLKGMSSYICNECAQNKNSSCRTMKQYTGKCCEQGCPYLAARSLAQSSQMALFNFHSYFVNKMYKQSVIIDEAHGAVDLLYGLFGKNLWKCEVGYPDDTPMTPEGVSSVISKLVSDLEDRVSMMLKNRMTSEMVDALQDEIDSFGMLLSALGTCGNGFLIKEKKDIYRGSVTQCKGTEQSYIYIKTMQIDTLAEKVLWPKDVVKKIIMTSATIGKEDIALLGLSDRKVAYYDCPSSIPAINRPFFIEPIANMTYKHRQESIPKIAKRIMELAERHKGTKGVIHCTYDVALKLKDMIHGPRFMFHDTKNKDIVLSAFMASKKDHILVASGMAEGIDLKDDLARWQVITMLQWPSMKDDVMAWIAANYPRRYKWMAIRNLIQQTGRIVRNPTDWGTTYFLGSELTQEFFYATQDMWPKWFIEAMRWL
jgi:hypothetical protein